LDLLTNNKNQDFYPSNLLPLWAGCHNFARSLLSKIVNQLNHSAIEDYPGGIPTSMWNTTEQWDFPNAWSPLQYFLIEGLQNINSSVARKFAFRLTQKWITTNYCAWNSTGGVDGGIMFEKYDATRIGVPGHGGEYHVQAGFGWTNGVALHFLQEFGNELKAPKCN